MFDPVSRDAKEKVLYHGSYDLKNDRIINIIELTTMK